MGILLSIASCGAYSTPAMDEFDKSLNDVAKGAKNYFTGAAKKERLEKEKFERQTRVEEKIAERERDVKDLLRQVEELNKRALRSLALLRQPTASPSVKQKASAEARVVLRGKVALEKQIQTRQKMIDIARRTLSAASTAKTQDADKELMTDLAALSRDLKFDDASITTLQESGIETIENTAELEQHLDEMHDAVLTLDDPDQDKGTAYDLNQESSLLSALQDLEAEMQTKVAPTPAKKKPTQRATSNANADDDDNDDLREVPIDVMRFPPAATETIYMGENTNRATSSSSSSSSAYSSSTTHQRQQAPPKRVAIAETTDGSFRQSQGNQSLTRNASSATTSSGKHKSDLDFF